MIENQKIQVRNQEDREEELMAELNQIIIGNVGEELSGEERERKAYILATLKHLGVNTIALMADMESYDKRKRIDKLKLNLRYRFDKVSEYMKGRVEKIKIGEETVKIRWKKRERFGFFKVDTEEGDRIGVFLDSINARNLFISGIHGNEMEAGDKMKALFRQYPDLDLACIPNANLPAVREELRDLEGEEFNREFFRNGISRIPRVELMKRVFEAFKNTRYVFSFHQDNDENSQFYMYDTSRFSRYGQDQELTEQILRQFEVLKKEILKHPELGGIFSGYDDMKDPKLRNVVKDGYVRTVSFLSRMGSFEDWAVQKGYWRENKVKRAFTFEIPGHLSSENKDLLVKLIFEYFINPLSKL